MLGKYVRTERRRRNWTQTTLSERSGVAQSYISDLENGKYDNPSMEVVRGLAAAFMLSVPDLLVAAGLGPPSEPDELADLLARARALGLPASLLDRTAREAQAGQMPEAERRALLRDLRRYLDEAERQIATRPPESEPPAEPQPQPGQARLVGRNRGAHAGAAPGPHADGWAGAMARVDERARGVSEARAGYEVVT
jgi:putative transcriptional regulator